MTPSGGTPVPRRGGSLPRGLLWVAAVVAVGVVCGLLWWWAAPFARTEVSDGSVYLTGHQELQAAQDGWFAVVLGALGVLTATVHGWRGHGHARDGGRQAVQLLLICVGLLLVGAIAWQTGVWLGPSDLADQVADGVRRPLTPLQLHSPGALLVGPFLFAFTSFLAALFAGGSSRPR